MFENDYSESLFRSIDTIVAERIKNLPYDATQLVEIVDDTNANAGIYKVTSNQQLQEIAYSDNPTYETGDKVYMLNTADNKRRFIVGLYSRKTAGRTDRILSILNGQVVSLKDLFDKRINTEINNINQQIDGLNIQIGTTADGFMSLVESVEEGLKTAIIQTASEIRLETENMQAGLESILSITAGEIRSEVYDFSSGLESLISQTAGEIRSEVHDQYNGLESKISQTAREIRSEVYDHNNSMYSVISQTASEIRSEVHDDKNNLESLISQTAGEIRSEVYDHNNNMYSHISQTADEIKTEVSDVNNGLRSEISQTANEIRSEVSDINNGLRSEISQTASEIRSEVSDIEQGLSVVSQTAAEIDSKVINLQGDFSNINQTAESIIQRVESIEGDYSQLVITNNNISQHVEDLIGNYSDISQSAGEIINRVNSLEGNVSEITQTADYINSRVEDMANNYSEIDQRVDRITLTVQDTNNNYSLIEQRVDGITSIVENVEQGYSALDQEANSIRLSVVGLDEKYTSLKATVDGFDLDIVEENTYNRLQGRINGWAFQKMDENGNYSETTIDGSNITSGTITGKQINASNFNIISTDADDKVTGAIEMYEGSTGVIATHGVGMHSEDYIVAVTDGGVRISDYNPNDPKVANRQVYVDNDSIDLKLIKNNVTNHIWLGGDNNNIVLENSAHKMHINVNQDSAYIVKTNSANQDEAYIALYSSYSDAATKNTQGTKENTIKLGAKHIHLEGTVYGQDGSVLHSDKDVKNDISYEMQKYENFYELIKPVYYKLNEGTSNRYHIGYIYQDIESALLESGLTSQDFAGVVKAYQNNGELFCGLRYEEFIPLNTYMIQKTRKELEKKDKKIQQLENKIDELEQKLNLLLETLS